MLYHHSSTIGWVDCRTLCTCECAMWGFLRLVNPQLCLFFHPPISRRQCHSGRHTRADGSSGFSTSLNVNGMLFGALWSFVVSAHRGCSILRPTLQRSVLAFLTLMHSFVAILFLFHGQRLNLQPCITLRILHITVHSSTLISSTLLNRAVLPLLPAFPYPAAWRESPGF